MLAFRLLGKVAFGYDYQAVGTDGLGFGGYFAVSYGAVADGDFLKSKHFGIFGTGRDFLNFGGASKRNVVRVTGIGLNFERFRCHIHALHSAQHALHGWRRSLREDGIHEK